MKAHISSHYEDIKSGEPIAIVRPAKAESVAQVLSADLNTGNGRSDWVWLRLANNDLALAIFPQGATYEDVQDDALCWGDDGDSRFFQGPVIPEGDAVALIHPANPELVDQVLALATGDGDEAQWNWVRLANGDLAIGVFQAENLPPEIAADAAWPGVAPNEPEDGLSL